jgi:hypothetical protein
VPRCTATARRKGRCSGGGQGKRRDGKGSASARQRCSPGNGSGDATQGRRVAARGRRPRHMESRAVFKKPAETKKSAPSDPAGFRKNWPNSVKFGENRPKSI